MFCAPEGRRRGTSPLVRVFYGNALRCPLTVMVQAHVYGRYGDLKTSLMGRYIVSTVSETRTDVSEERYASNFRTKQPKKSSVLYATS